MNRIVPRPMREYRNGVVAANKARQLRQIYTDASMMVVEGERDVRFFRNIVDENKCQVLDGNGKPNVLGAILILQGENFDGVLGIVDDDFDSLENIHINNPDIIVTDNHDLEIMLIVSPSLEKVLVENNWTYNEINNNIRVKLFNAVRLLGYLRWYSKKMNLGINFDKLNFCEVVDIGNVSIDIAKCISSALQQLDKNTHSPTTLMQGIHRLYSDSHDILSVCNGHDVVYFIAMWMSKRSGNTVMASTVERQLRLAYEICYFQGTELYRGIVNWEKENSPFSILKEDALIPA